MQTPFFWGAGRLLFPDGRLLFEGTCFWALERESKGKLKRGGSISHFDSLRVALVSGKMFKNTSLFWETSVWFADAWRELCPQHCPGQNCLYTYKPAIMGSGSILNIRLSLT